MSSFAQRRSSGLHVRTPQPGRTSSQHSRRSSGASIQISPVTSHFESPLHTGPALGASLADELEEGWDEEGGEGGEDGEGYAGDDDGRHADDHCAPHTPDRSTRGGVMHHTPSGSFSNDRVAVRSGEGNDRNHDHDDDDDTRYASPSKGFTPFLERGMADIDSLARQGRQATDASDGIWERAIAQLRDLPPQLKLENSTSRFTTAQSAVATHIENTSRSWPLLTRTITSVWAPTSSKLDADSLAALDTLVTGLVDSLPRSVDDNVAYNGLRQLNAQTSDLLDVLAAVIDQLHMQKQASTKAAQKLKAVRDVVVALRREFDIGDQAAQWLDDGRWHARLQAREAAGVCRDVVRGFEEHCDMWRSRLIAMDGGQANNNVAVDVSAQ